MAKKKPAGKQQRLPSMEDPVIPEIDAAAVAHEKNVNARVKATNKETESQETLQEMLVKHNVEVYRHDGRLVKLNKKTTQKATVEPDPDEAAPTSDEDAETEE
jgi:hypothetical protein